MKAKKKAAQKKTTAKKSEVERASILAEPVALVAEPVAATTTIEAFAAQAAIPEQPAKPAAPRTISTDERRRLIQLAAYYRAERIGFGKTDPVENWLIAEREIDAMVSASN